MYVLRDDVEDSLPLPKGEKEVPLVICDHTFLEDGSFYYPSLDPSLTETPGTLAHAVNGFFGDTVLVNGAPWPYLEVSDTLYRFRILNASNARVYDLALDPPPGGEPLAQVGSDVCGHPPVSTPTTRSRDNTAVLCKNSASSRM